MAKLKYTPNALEDLQAVKSYITRQFGAEIAGKKMQALTSTIRQLEKFPEEGLHLQKFIDYPTEYRYLVAKPNYIFYRIEGDIVRIIRILNEKQDFLQTIFGISSITEEGERYWSKIEDN